MPGPLSQESLQILWEENFGVTLLEHWILIGVLHIHNEPEQVVPISSKFMREKGRDGR